MNNIIKSFLILWLLMFSKGAQSQKKNSILFENLNKTQYLLHLNAPQNHDTVLFNSPRLSANLVSGISADWYSKNLGIFCRNELKMDKLTPLPIRFRLGSLEYVNWMEQKPNAAAPR